MAARSTWSGAEGEARRIELSLSPLPPSGRDTATPAAESKPSKVPAAILIGTGALAFAGGAALLASRSLRGFTRKLALSPTRGDTTLR